MSMVSLSAEGWRNLKEAWGRRGYTLPRFASTGLIRLDKWESWQKLQRAGLAIIEGSGEASPPSADNSGSAAREARSL